jgi:hypothetical protein
MDKQPKLCHTRRGRVRVRATTPCRPAGRLPLAPFWPVPAAFTRRRQEHALLLHGSDTPRAAACAHQPPPASRRAGALRCPSAPQHRCIGISGPGCDENRVASGLTWCSSSPILSSLREARRNRPGTRLYLRKETIRFLRTGSIGR